MREGWSVISGVRGGSEIAEGEEVWKGGGRVREESRPLSLLALAEVHSDQ